MDSTNDRINLLEQRCKLLRTICEFEVDHTSARGAETILRQCLQTLLTDREYRFIWIGKKTDNSQTVQPFLAGSSTGLTPEQSMAIAVDFTSGSEGDQAADIAFATGEPVIVRGIEPEKIKPEQLKLMRETETRSYCSWPLHSNNQKHGVITVHSANPNGFSGSEVDFIANVAGDISQALYVDATVKRLRLERDFNSEIVDTVQALLVSLSPCGNILSFNQKAQDVTGFSEESVKGKYWVDVLIAPDIRPESQAELSGLLQDDGSDMNFQTELLTRKGENRLINWHGSIRPNIDQGKVGLVLFGIDVTSKVKADHERVNALAKWNNIFSAMQDPALVVSDKGVILDVNPATSQAAQKSRSTIIGQSVCDILHGGRSPGATCPLETILRDKKNRVFETELRGLQGHYMMTISPLKEYGGTTGASLLLARDLTEEQLMKAEALRAAQLASVGELAAGVAHEINNPINGIINYAQILKDSGRNAGTDHFIDRIIKEGKRIAGITKNLLDFSRKREEAPEPVDVVPLIEHCIELVSHQFTLDSISIQEEYGDDLPKVLCNPQQMQQVFLNIFSNARYALNERWDTAVNDRKLLQICACPTRIEDRAYVELTITDNGTGIEHEIIDRVMDPFFSTKNSGRGTGLGLSICHSLVQDNNGILRIQSELGKYTTLIIDLPVNTGTGDHDVNPN